MLGPYWPSSPYHTPLTPRALQRARSLAPPSPNLPGSSAAWLRPCPEPPGGRSTPPRRTEDCRPGAPRAEAAAPALGIHRPRGAVGSRRAPSPAAQGGGGGAAATEGAGSRCAHTGHARSARGGGKSIGDRASRIKEAGLQRRRRWLVLRGHWKFLGCTRPLESRLNP